MAGTRSPGYNSWPGQFSNSVEALLVSSHLERYASIWAKLRCKFVKMPKNSLLTSWAQWTPICKQYTVFVVHSGDWLDHIVKLFMHL